MQPFYWVIENQPMVSLILAHQVAENNLEADERGHWKRKGRSCLFIYIYTIDLLPKHITQ